MKKRKKALCTMAVAMSMLVTGATANAAVSLNVDSHSQQEIRAKIQNSGGIVFDKVQYSVKPIIKAPYSIGELSEATQSSGIKLINNIRYIAGLDDNVTADKDAVKSAQAAAAISAINDELSHNPEKPEGMSDEMYQLCASGAGSSNLASGGETVNDAIIMWLDDGPTGSFGHRRWILNPRMGKTGLGYAEAYSAMYAFDGSNDGNQTRVAWPARQTPIDYIDPYGGEYFSDSHTYGWTLSTGKNEDINSVQVQLERERDNRTWYFGKGKNQNSKNSGYFNVNNNGYGQKGCIIFTPNKVVYSNGDVYHVTITGAVEGTIKYDVNFFAMVPVTSLSFVAPFSTLQLRNESDLKVKITPVNSSEKIIEYSSSNPNVVSYEDGIVCAHNAGTAVVTARAGGKSISRKITVPKQTLNDEDIFYSNVNSEYVYTGKEILPNPKVEHYYSVLEDEVLLKKGTEYTVTYGANKEIGKGRVTVSGKGNYTGSHSINFKIVPAKVKTVSARAKRKAVTVKFSKVKGASNYQIYIKQKNKKARIINVKGNKTVKKLKAGKAKIKVRGYKTVNGKKYCGAWSKTKNVRVK